MDMTSQDLAEFLSGCSVEYNQLERERAFPALVVPDKVTYLHGFVEHCVNQWAIEEYGRAEFKHSDPKEAA